VTQHAPFVPPPLIPDQVQRITQQQRAARYWRNATFINFVVFFFAPLLLHYQLWIYLWALGIVCAIVSGLTAYRRWVLEHKRFKVLVCESLLGRVLDKKIPLHTFSPIRQLSRDWIRITHFYFDENVFYGPYADENLLYKVFSTGNIEIFSVDLTGDFGLKKKNFRGCFGTFASKEQIRPRNLVVTFGKMARLAPLEEVPKTFRVFSFTNVVKGVEETDPDFELLIRIATLYDEMKDAVDLKWLRVTVESRFVNIAVWTNDTFFDVPGDVNVDAKDIYPHWRRYTRAYTLLAKFLQRNFVPSKEHSSIHWY
jgi:hypothetical protein